MDIKDESAAMFSTLFYMELEVRNISGGNLFESAKLYGALKCAEHAAVQFRLSEKINAEGDMDDHRDQFYDALDEYKSALFNLRYPEKPVSEDLNA